MTRMDALLLQVHEDLCGPPRWRPSKSDVQRALRELIAGEFDWILDDTPVGLDRYCVRFTKWEEFGPPGSMDPAGSRMFCFLHVHTADLFMAKEEFSKRFLDEVRGLLRVDKKHDS